MPMIDIYAAAGTFSDAKKLERDAAALVKSVEQVPDIPMFRKNTAAFIHEMAPATVSNVDGDANYVRVQVLTNAGALDRDKQIALVGKMTDLVATAAGDPDPDLDRLRTSPEALNDLFQVFKAAAKQRTGDKAK